MSQVRIFVYVKTPKRERDNRDILEENDKGCKLFKWVVNIGMLMICICMFLSSKLYVLCSFKLEYLHVA